MIRGGERSADGQRAGDRDMQSGLGGKKKKKKKKILERKEKGKRGGGTKRGKKEGRTGSPCDVFNIHEMSPFSFSTCWRL